MPLTNPVHISPKYVYERGTNLQNLTFGPPIKDSKSLVPVDFYAKTLDTQDKIDYEPARVSLADIYEDQINGWFFNIVLGAFKTKDGGAGDAGFVILMASLAFFENHAQFLDGVNTHKKSSLSFKKSFKEVFKSSLSLGFSIEKMDEVSDVFYQNLRNGLFHTSMIRRGVELNSNLKQPFKVEWNKNSQIQLIIVNPIIFLEAVQKYFNNYINDLKNDKNLQENLESGWKILFEPSSDFLDEVTQFSPPQVLQNTENPSNQSGNSSNYSGGTVIRG